MNLGLMMNFGAGELEWLKTAINSLYTELKGIVTALMILCTIICLCGMLFSKNQKTVEEYKSWFKRIIVCYVIYILLGTITNTISSLFTNKQGITDAFK